MAAKKKGDATTTSTDTTTATTTPQDEAAPGQEPATGNEDITVEDIAEGQHEVDLLDLGISAEDIAAMRRVDARLEEARKAKIQALQEESAEPQIITRAKGKEIMFTEEERQEQYNKLQDQSTTTATRKNAGTAAAAAIAEGHGRNEPTKKHKRPNKDYTSRRDL